MTAEIVIINQQAVALAADSAVTIGKKRVWKHANKLFSAGPQHDIGVMVYNSGDFLSVPWEIIIKEHRKTVRSKTFNRLQDFADDLIRFVCSDRFAGKKFEELSFGFIFSDIIDTIASEIECKTKSELQRQILLEIRKQTRDLASVEELSCTFDYATFRKNYIKVIKGLTVDVFGVNIGRQPLEDLSLLIFTHIIHASSSEYSTGVVIAGYGTDQLFPSVINYTVDGRWKNFTRIWREEPFIDLNVSRSQNAAIIPFAQVDMAHLFMEGITTKYIEFMCNTLDGALSEKVKEILKNCVNDPSQRLVEQTLQKSKLLQWSNLLLMSSKCTAR